MDRVAVVVESRQVLRDVLVAIQLCSEDGGGGADIADGGVRLLVLTLQVKPGRRREVARLLVVEDELHVDEFAAADVEVDPGPPEFGQQHGHVEAPDVEAGQVAGVQHLVEGLRPSGERSLARHVLVADAVHGERLCRDRNAGIEAAHPLEHVPLG